MGPLNGRNLERVKYFSIKEYLSKIELESKTLEQMEIVNKEFDQYLEKLMQYDELAITLFLCNAFEEEIKYSNIIENHIVHPMEINSQNMFFDRLAINHNRIKELHKFVLKKDTISEYRTEDVRISAFYYLDEVNNKNYENIISIDGKEYYEDIYWYGAEAEDIKRFMDDFIAFYKDTGITVLHSNPFIKSALVHLLFLRIHPFNDGNGRTARLLHNMKFTDSINRIKGSNLKISPINISPGINQFKKTYAECIDNIYFDLEHFSYRNSNNPEINRWIKFLLNTAESEIFFLENQLEEKHEALENISEMKSEPELFSEEIRKMRMKVLAPKKY